MWKNICVLVIVGIVPIFTADLRPPVIKLFEVDESNTVIREYDRVDITRSEAIVERIDHLRIECQASYPVQWIYTGNGVPILSSYLSMSTTQEGGRIVNKYITSAFLSPLKESHTGNYQCSHTDYLTLSPSLYIYVPGPTIFTSLQGQTIQIPKNDSSILIPCSVSHPDVQVSLEKLERDATKTRITTSKDVKAYDPRRGFRVDISKIRDPEETYICIGRYRNRVKGVDYSIINSPQFGELVQAPTETCRGPSCAYQCETHSDCPPSKMNCYTDRQCRDPCSYSIECGKESMCRVINNVPECYCPPGFVGDATEACYNP
jgi:hypothetical protein